MTRNISNNADYLDIRDIIERFEELEQEREAIAAGCESDDDTNTQGKREELAAWDEDPDNAEFHTLKELLEELCGRGGDHQWKGDWYPVSLIRDSYFVEAMQELVSDIGDLPRELPSYLEIDWDKTADNLRQDYSSVEYDGVTYWYR